MGRGNGDSGIERAERSRPSGPMLAQWSPSSTDDERRALYQRRLQLFSHIFFWVFVSLIVWVNVMYWAFPSAAGKKYVEINYVGVGGVLLLVAIWRGLLCRFTYTVRTLFAFDVAITELIGVVLGINVYLAADKPANVYSVFIWATFLVFARACVIPSTLRRTLWISAGAFVPLLVGAIGIAVEYPDYVGTPGLLVVIGGVAYGAIASVLAAIGSAIIVGLRSKAETAQRLGQYTLGEPIGQGGMGVVYRAEHAMLRRPAALKLLHPERTGAHMLARFEREVRFTAELSHPNTVAIYDYGRSPEGVFYYVMEYLDGVDLEQLVRRFGPLPQGRVIQLLAQVCGSLAEAHARGLVHRDIKPANLMLCVRGTVPDVVKVCDFGLVKDIEESLDESSGVLAGTPAYLCPELITSSDAVSPQSDLYAVGAVGIFLLTGQLLFDVEGLVEVCIHHVNTEPVPPSKRTQNPVSDGLEQLLMKCLEKDPKDRPRSAAWLERELLALAELAEWSRDDGEQWWRDYRPKRSENADELGRARTVTVDLRGRAR